MVKKIFITIILILFLVGCGSRKTEETCNILTGECSGQVMMGEDKDDSIKNVSNENITNITSEDKDVEIDESDYDAVVEVEEGKLVKLNVQAEDEDGDELTYTFVKPLDSKGEWQTKEGDEGNYMTKVTVSDGKNTAESLILIKVTKAKNNPPTLEVEGDLEVSEGETVTLTVNANDPEGNKVEIAFYNDNFQQNGNTYTWKTNYEDAGTYSVNIKASDGINNVSKDLIVTVNDFNRPPVITIIGQE